MNRLLRWGEKNFQSVEKKESVVHTGLYAPRRESQGLTTTRVPTLAQS